jgi:GR25 family glycosyltransferase involved in LPS biosynthesis
MMMTNVTDILNKPGIDESRCVDVAWNGARNAMVEIVVISLPNATERRRKIDAQFEGTGLKWTYFDAHTSLKHSGLRYDPNEAKKRFGRTLSAPEIAICSSQVAALSDFLERGSTEYVLVLEDDVIFDTDFPLDQFCAFCSEQGIDYIRLFGKHYAKAVRLGFFFDRSILRYKSSPAGAQAYLMSKAGTRKFLERYRSIDTTVDLAMDRFWDLRLPIYSIFPYPVIERYSPTSIPMPPYVRELGRWENLVWQFNRTIAKLKKIRGNIALRSADRRMQRESWRFRQITDRAPE